MHKLENTLASAVPLQKEKLLNPGNKILYGGISSEKPVLILLAAGKGTRFGKNPKCIQPVCGTPLSRHTVDAFRAIASSPAICLIGYRHQQVQEALGNDNIYVQSQNPSGGTAMATWESFVVKDLADKDPLLCISMGDRIVPSAIFQRLLYTHQKGGEEAGLTFLTAQYEVPQNHGRGRILRNRRGDVERIVEQRDIDKEEDPVLRTALDALEECNCPLYVVRAKKLKKALSRITNDNAQNQYYLTDIISIFKEQQEEIRTVTITPDDVEYDLLSSDVTRPEDLAYLEGIMIANRGVISRQEFNVKKNAEVIRKGRSAGQIASIARQLEQLYYYLLKKETGFQPDKPIALGISGGRLRIAFMHPDMERFYGPAWQMPIGAKNEDGDEQIILLLQKTENNRIHLYPVNPRYQEKIDSVPSDNKWLFPSDDVNNLHTYEAFGSRLSENLLLSLGYFSDDELKTRQKKGIPLPPASLWINSNMRRPFPLIANAIASIRTLKSGNLGANVQNKFGRKAAGGLSIAITGNIPKGGFSSSSAVTVAMKNAINVLFDLEIPSDLLIHLASQAEYGTGVRAGSLDQATEQKGVYGDGALISSNPRDNYRILRSFPVPADRYSIIFPYSVERDCEAWKWSWGFYGPDENGVAPTAAEIRKMTGKSALIASILTRLPEHTDFFKVIEEDLLKNGELSFDKKKWITNTLRQLPLFIRKEKLRQITLQHLSRNEKTKAEKDIDFLFSEWREPKLPLSVVKGKPQAVAGVPLRAVVAYLFAEVVRNFYLIHHQDKWISRVTLSQRGDCCYDIDPDILPEREQLEKELEWERDYSGPERMELWLKKFHARPFDFNQGIKDHELKTENPVDFLKITGGNFFRGLALIDLAEAMLKRAFGENAIAVRVNAAGQGDYFQLHYDKEKADSNSIKTFLDRAFYNRFNLMPERRFVEVHPGGGAAGTVINRADLIPQLIQQLKTMS